MMKNHEAMKDSGIPGPPPESRDPEERNPPPGTGWTTGDPPLPRAGMRWSVWTGNGGLR